MKKSYIVIILLIIASTVVFINFYDKSLKGLSEDSTWKVVYKKIKGVEAGGAWGVSVVQENKHELIVEKITFLENNQVITDRAEFYEGVDIDGTKYTLHPFSYPDLYLGDKPKKDATYYVEIIWEDESGKKLEEKIELK